VLSISGKINQDQAFLLLSIAADDPRRVLVSFAGAAVLSG
jgi:hypothetical protein